MTEATKSSKDQLYWLCSAGGFARWNGQETVGPSERLVVLAADYERLEDEIERLTRSLLFEIGGTDSLQRQVQKRGEQIERLRAALSNGAVERHERLGVTSGVTAGSGVGTLAIPAVETTSDEPFRGSWNCKARRTADPPQDCDWPHCGCDSHASKVVEALTEEGWRPPEKATQCNCGYEKSQLTAQPFQAHASWCSRLAEKTS